MEQVPGHSQLRTVEAGLDLLRSARGPIAPVVVIGPYRSGKSFLLNQLLGVSCGEGPGAPRAAAHGARRVDRGRLDQGETPLAQWTWPGSVPYTPEAACMQACRPPRAL